MEIILAVLSGFLVAIIAPGIHRVGRGAFTPYLALLPLGIFLYFLTLLPPVAAGEVLVASYAWLPSLGVNLSFRVDGLGLLFALLISGIGTLIAVYAKGYLGDHRYLGRFYAFLLFFMASMLGLVLADNLIALFIFWELTSVSSYLLIGFNHESEKSRYAALQALLVTGVGGLAMLAGFVLLGLIGGDFELSVLLTRGDAIRAHPLYLPVLLLVLAGAFTKSAQFPFHFWLPNAMEAPTPVSAYLHSATMVKAGIYLLARTQPMLGGTEAWFALVTGAGAATMVIGGALAICQTDLKRLLAYTTVGALGVLTMLLGLGGFLAAKAALTFLLAHALYKGALFMLAGAVDHETGSRDVSALGGLRRAMPVSAAAALAAGVAMAGLGPVVFSFVGKELFFEAVLETGGLTLPLGAAALLTGGFFAAVAVLVAVRPFWGEEKPTPKKQVHEASWQLLLGPVVLAVLGVGLAAACPQIATLLVGPAVASVIGTPQEVSLSLWHGLNPALYMSLGSLALGLLVYGAWRPLLGCVPLLKRALAWGPERCYDAAVAGMLATAGLSTRLLQNGTLRYYLLMTLAAVVGLTGYALARGVVLDWAVDWTDVRPHEAALCVLILLAALAVTLSRSRLAAVAAMGVVGFGIAVVFVLFGAPDLAMTQFMIETLTVILFVLVFYHLPGMTAYPRKWTRRLRDAAIALATGGLMTALILATLAVERTAHLADYFVAESVPAAHGRNIVNVILVDFRALDTLGEITVLAIAAVGVYALLKLRLHKSAQSPQDGSATVRERPPSGEIPEPGSGKGGA